MTIHLSKMRKKRGFVAVVVIVFLFCFVGNSSPISLTKRLVLTAEDPDSPGQPILLPFVSDSFVPNCGTDDEEEDGEESGEDGTSMVKPTPPSPPSVWLGYSSKLFGGFFNLTISGGEVKPFGRCVASSQKFSLIEQEQALLNNGEHDSRCYRCMFVDRRSSPHVVQMRTTPLQCLASPNNAGADTLYRVCASLSPSLPLLTLLKISDTKSATKCPFEVGNYRVSYEFSSCSNQPTSSNGCIDKRGVHFYFDGSSLCDGQFRGAVSLECLATWKADTGDHHSFAFLRFQHGTQSSIRCAIYHHQRRHHVASGFALALASGFDCSELNGVLLKSSPQLSRTSHLNVKQNSASHIFHFSPILNETPTTKPTTTSTLAPTSPLFMTTTIDNTKHNRESNNNVATTMAACDLPNFVLMAKNWHSFDASSFQLVPSSSSGFTIFINNKDADRTTLYLSCVETEIGGDSVSRIYQAVYSVSVNNPGVLSNKQIKKRSTPDFTCSAAFFAKNSTSTHLTVEPGTAKRAQRQQPTASTISTLNLVTVTMKQRQRSSKTMTVYHRCVKFYQRDRHVIELVLGSPSNGPTSLVCADNVKEDHRVLLVDGGIFMGYSSDECLSIPMPGFLSGHYHHQQQQQHKHLQTAAIKTPPVDTVLNEACLVRLCSAISSKPRNNNHQQLTYLVFRKGSTCPAEADPDVTLFYAFQQCAYRWRRDYVTDNLLFSPIVKIAPKNDEISSPLSCFILQHNGIASTTSTLIPNPNCWLNGQLNFTSPTTLNSSNSNGTSQLLDEFIGFAFNAQEACHWPSQPPSFVNSNNDDVQDDSIERIDSSLLPAPALDNTGVERETSSFYETSSEFWSRLTSNGNNAVKNNVSLLFLLLLSPSYIYVIITTHLFLVVNL